MKLQADRMEGEHAIARHGAEGVVVGAKTYRDSVLVPWRGSVQTWGVDAFELLDARHFEAIAALAPELVLFGSGRRLRFVRPAHLAPLFERRIGIETMDTAAACRTYNVLLAEGRSVVAALLFEGVSNAGA